MSIKAAVLESTLDRDSELVAPAPLRVLSYVHMRNIHGSTGAGRTARQIVEHLSRRGDIDLRVLADASDKARILPLVGAPWTEYTYHTFPADTSKQQARWFLMERPKAEAFWPEAQVVFCTGESFVPVGKAALVMTAHDAGYFESAAHRRDATYWKQRLKWTLLFRKLIKRVDLFHTVSEFSAERLQHFFPEIRGRIRAVHNGVTPHFFEPVPAEGLAYLKKMGLIDRQYLLIPGGLHFRKNAELILEGAAQLLKRFPELLVLVVNHSNPVYVEAARTISSRLWLLGFVTDEALHALYEHATVVWFPSRYEGFGLPVVEAMACGAPVVASNASSMPEIAGSAAVLADPADVKAHTEAISGLLQDERSRMQLSQMGKDRAQKFTWNRCAAELKQTFDTLL